MIPSVSVIIPSYNVRNEISRCVESVLAQTLQNIQIIVVDDCSTDGTYDILQDYARYNSNITLLRNDKNHGAGYSKNRGLSIAQSKFVGFVDSDDHIVNDYYERLYNAILEFDADIALADMVLEFKANNNVINIMDNNVFLENTKKYIEGSTAKPMLIDGIVIAGNSIGLSACTKLFSKELLSKYPFFEGMCDDIPSVLLALANAKRCAYVPGIYYNYVQRTNSLERSDLSVRCKSIALSINDAVNRIRKSGAKDNFIQLLYAVNVIGLLLRVTSEYRIADMRKRAVINFVSGLNDKQFLSDSRNNLLSGLKNIHGKFIMDYFNALSLEKYDVADKIIINHLYRGNDFYPLVSIIIPVYNGSNYLRYAIDSALNQSYPNVEVIVVNDGSRDNGETEEIALSYGNRIRYFLKENGGVASALNLGIDKMRGEYFSWLSHDDLYTPQKIENEVIILSTLEDKKTIIAGGYIVVNENEKFLYHVNLLDMYSSKQLENPLFLIFRGGVHGCALLIHKSHFERVGNFDVNLPTTQDYDLWFRMFRNEKILYHDKLNVKSRVHEEQGSKKFKDSHIIESNNLWISMMNNLTNEERTCLDGSPYSFYQNTAKFLMAAIGHNRAVEHANLMALHETVSEMKLMIKELVNQRAEFSQTPQIISPSISPTGDYIYEELVRMQNSLSWRITKPLRLLNKFRKYAKTFGIVAAIKKALKVIFRKF